MSAAPAPKARGGDAVRAALIRAAADMLGELGPRGISVRDLAERAGVNHGQIHHYFGGKRGLLEAAMRSLAHEHFEHAMEKQGDADHPPALSLADDSGYWRAICQTVISGDLELAAIEIEEGASVPRHVFESIQRARGVSETTAAHKAAFIVMAVQQLGWVAFERFFFLLADVQPHEEGEVRAHARVLMEREIEDQIR